MAKIKCKGTLLKQTISMSLTSVAQIISLEHSGAESETYESTTLDGGVFKTYDQTGYAEGGSVNGELFYDPALSGHQSFTDLVAAPADVVFTITFADGAATVQTFTAAGYGFGAKVAMNDGLKGSFSLKIDGDPGFPS